MKKYITYEEPHAGETFNFSGIQRIYNQEVNHIEYATFQDWLHDMLKSGVFCCS